jgi:hypothetical protein
MKVIIARYQRLRTLRRILERYPTAFAGKLTALKAIQDLGIITERMAVIITELVKPLSFFFRPKQDMERQLRLWNLNLSGIGMAVARALENAPLLDLMKEYHRHSQRCSAFKLHEYAVHIYDELTVIKIEAAKAGLTEQQLEDYRTLIDDFNEILENKLELLIQRKAIREELNSLLKESSALFRHQFDTFVQFIALEFPALYREYKLARRRKSHYKPGDDEPKWADLSGTVTDAVTSLPIPEAYVEITDLGFIMPVDEAGYFLIDEIPAGTYPVSCHAPAYTEPAIQQVTFAECESLVLNFSLSPAETENNPSG